jgi:dual specificity protein kinase YAK1
MDKDKEDHNLIVSVRDILIGGNDERYIVLDLLGQDTFGQIFRCQIEKTKEFVTIKVIRNHPSYYK